MRSITHTIYDMEHGDTMLVSSHFNSVTLMNTCSPEFSVRLQPCHLPVIRDLLRDLERLEMRIKKEEKLVSSEPVF